ncbi:MAG: phenylalanine--tRNA ligase subunit beta, partial [Salinisphaera sp.]|nr:phenylalanine--tRNA ligase subunit beta [Salinisphaera sp.]
GPVTVAGGPRKATAAITLRRDRLQRLLGSAVAEAEIVDILTRLCMKVTAGGGAGIWQVVPPSHRHDLHLEADLIEEVARIHGYDRLQARKRPVFAAISAPPAQQRSWPELRAVLLQQGYDEAVSYSFVNADLQQALCPDLLAVDLDNPIAAPYAQMRTTLWSSLLPCWLHNRRRQQTRVRLFERGLRFARARGQEQTPVETMTIAGLAQGDAAPEHWSRAARPVDFFDVKGDIARLFGRHAQALRFTREAHAALHPGRSARIHFRDRAVGWVGQLHPKMKRVLDDYEMPYVFELDSNALETRPAVGLESLSDYPELRRDLALVVDEAVTAGDLLTAIEALGMKTLRRVKVFDLFRGAELEPGCKSLALGLIFQDKSRTLIASSVDAAVGEIVETLQERCGARVRGQ